MKKSLLLVSRKIEWGLAWRHSENSHSLSRTLHGSVLEKSLTRMGENDHCFESSDCINSNKIQYEIWSYFSQTFNIWSLKLHQEHHSNSEQRLWIFTYFEILNHQIHNDLLKLHSSWLVDFFIGKFGFIFQ